MSRPGGGRGGARSGLASSSTHGRRSRAETSARDTPVPDVGPCQRTPVASDRVGSEEPRSGRECRQNRTIPCSNSKNSRLAFGSQASSPPTRRPPAWSSGQSVTTRSYGRVAVAFHAGMPRNENRQHDNDLRRPSRSLVSPASARTTCAAGGRATPSIAPVSTSCPTCSAEPGGQQRSSWTSPRRAACMKSCSASDRSAPASFGGDAHG